MKSTTTSEMRRSWLVQRLEKPRNYGQLRDNPFSFGGGFKNGGLSDDAMDILRPIFSFDYMGAAEFEFGAVPNALNGIAQAASKKRGLVADRVTVDLSLVPPAWDDKSGPLSGEAEVFYLAKRDHAAEVAARITAWSAEAHPRMKELLNLARALRPQDDYDRRTCGWLELDNGFMFFTDRDMWAQTCAVFGIEVSA